jgi:tetrahydromethanopterin S-methyltransferase subunit B
VLAGRREEVSHRALDDIRESIAELRTTARGCLRALASRLKAFRDLPARNSQVSTTVSG